MQKKVTKSHVLILIRHAIAMDREKAKKSRIPDRLRPLTKKGKRQFKEFLFRLRDLDSFQNKIKQARIYQSSYLRSKQTAELLADHCQSEEVMKNKKTSKIDKNGKRGKQLKKFYTLKGVTPFARPQGLRNKLISAAVIGGHLGGGSKMHESCGATVIVSHEPFISRFLTLVAHDDERGGQKIKLKKIKKGSFSVLKYRVIGNRVIVKSFVLLS